MPNRSPKARITRRSPVPLLIVFMLLICAAFVWVAYNTTAQSVPALVADVRFEGEYRIGTGAWQPIVEDEHIPATDGDVTLRGRFCLYEPISETSEGVPAKGLTICLYLNHLGGSILSPDGQTLVFDTEHQTIGEDACAVMWCDYTIPTDDEQAVYTIVLRNPHRFGNACAVDQFLDFMTIAPDTRLSDGTIEHTIGVVILICALIILGIAVFSSILHISSSAAMWLIGLMAFFAGGYFVFDAFAISLRVTPFIINTRLLGLCMMLYLLFLGALVALLLRGTPRRIATAASLLSGVSVLGCILCSFSPSIKFFDTWGYWVMIEIPVVLVLLGCLVCHLRRCALVERLLCCSFIPALLAFPIDAIATHQGLWEGGFISKHVFLLIFAMAFVIVLSIIPSNINAAIKAKQLEAEQKALQLELQESRISIMLSQMQPHFIFNTLNTIYHLCDIDPEIARRTISSFSEYLRNNIDNLGQSEMISFEKELSFVKTYLDIEKVRFDDELEITFDIGASNFKLPVLTVQPIVENAVKHGTSKKQGVSQLRVSTRETEQAYEIVIEDTGVGFDPDSYQNDGHKHVGISSVRQRLQHLCGGTLTVESVLGEGTTATIQIPKQEEYYENHRRR